MPWLWSCWRHHPLPSNKSGRATRLSAARFWLGPMLPESVVAGVHFQNIGFLPHMSIYNISTYHYKAFYWDTRLDFAGEPAMRTKRRLALREEEGSDESENPLLAYLDAVNIYSRPRRPKRQTRTPYKMKQMMGKYYSPKTGQGR